METDNESIDISSIKFAVLQQPLESVHEQPSSEDSLVGGQQHSTTKSAFAQPSQVQPALPAAGPFFDAVPELASTVPDSQLPLASDVGVDTQLQLLPLPPPFAVSSKPISAAQKIMSQASDIATQELSPSHFESILNRSRSAVDQQPEEDGHEDETQPTLHEGDEGHIDLISSFVSPREEVKGADSDQVDFSPTQTQHGLPQFPESQCFKTPAAAGKKRKYNGDVMDSPILPRNPLRGGNVESTAHVMGLSQAFAATQANTSPFIQNINSELRSDRPSPNIDLQPRPFTVASPSPLRPLSVFKRASTEPASRYISVKQSQMERERQAQLKQQGMTDNDDDDDDGFGDEPGSIATSRRKEVEKRRRAAFDRLSSPSKHPRRGVSLSKSSPIRGPSRDSPRRAPSVSPNKLLDHSSPAHDNHPSPGRESEEETEQEDNADIAVTRSSQGLLLLDEEDKENFSDGGSQVPETTARLQRIMNDLPPQVQDSPLLSTRRGSNHINQLTTLYSSEPFAVADSQPSQMLKQRQAVTQTPKSTSAEGSDFVPQSPTASPQRTITAHRDSSEGPLENRTSEEGESDRVPEEATVTSALHSTIPETSSNEEGQNGNSLGNSKTKQQTLDSRGEFEIAQTRLPTGANSDRPSVVGLSSPPVITTPPGRRRKRMAEIAAEPSPFKSQPSFNASEALQFDPDFQSPFKDGSPFAIEAYDEANQAGSQYCLAETHQETIAGQMSGTNGPSEHQEAQNTISRVAQVLGNNRIESILSSYPRRERKPTSKLPAASKYQTQPVYSASRISTWDLDVSPPPKSVPVIKPALKRKANDFEQPQNGNTIAVTKRPKPTKGKLSSKTSLLADPGGDEQRDSPDPITLSELAKSESGKEEARVSTRTVTAPNMVFACFNGKTRAYYPARCLGPSTKNEGRFSIQWEGYEPDEIDEHGIRSLDLRIGDQVKVNMEGVPKVSYIIRGFKDKIVQGNADSDRHTITDVQGFKTLLVAPKQRKSLPADMSTNCVKKVPVSSIYLDNNMWGQMKNRVYEYKPSIHEALLSGISTPLDPASAPSTPPSRSRRGATITAPLASGPTTIPNVSPEGIFANMAFAISYEDSWRKNKLASLIQSNGGLVLKESFLDLFETDSTELRSQFSDLYFTALLTERHSRKEKYMQALALGIPCLSGKWAEACINANGIVDWKTYLLPAGESAELDGATRSRILPVSQYSTLVKVEEMISSRLQMLQGSRVAVVSGRGRADARRPVFMFLIRALGAQTVVVEPDLGSAKAALDKSRVNGDDEGDCEGDTVDYVLVDDRDIQAARAMFSPPPSEKSGKKSRIEMEQHPPLPQTQAEQRNVKVLCNEDIVQSLILGRLWVR
ncbi:uncharacterized protein Z518_00935 [Rhinocladiella mackenziei CBS 650.93]|uniref:BRCT domain-containing protein n=1 Tax=Rhinocladiella mackenziei CBS 650.93 TaxID=1442369 RepID=A0A0D2IUS6_9EURO|nr:uncharacterized protein Z518_00935 [Rhinocladiella mackenziei CBS 650.93]KIX09854.1 hypothetical protein Z518_00935 [Rhinocladiella mackenziei CBS 650.93]